MIYKVNNNIAFDHAQGAFMFYIEGGVKMIPLHFISRFELGEDNVVVVCETKYLKERISVESSQPDADLEKLQILMESF